MNNRVFMWSCFVMTFFVACQQAEVENPKAEELRMSISASINGQDENPKSRYAGSDPDDVDFAPDDAIGLFIDDKPAIEWCYDGTDWGPAGNEIVYWPDKTNPHTFRAFYPYDPADSYKEVPMPSLVNQTGTMVSISACDFLVATSKQTYSTGGFVYFNGDDTSFRHVSTLLQLSFQKGSELNDLTIHKITLEGNNIASPSTYSFEDGTVSLDTENSIDVLTIDQTSLSEKNTSFYLIVNASQEENPMVSLTVEYETNGKTYVAHSASLVQAGLQGGMYQKYTITVQNSSLIIDGAEILPWGVGETLDNIEINGAEKTDSE